MRTTSTLMRIILTLVISVFALDSNPDSYSSNVDEIQDHITINLPGLAEDAVPLEMILVRPGSFIMGSDQEQLGRFGSPWPKHQVTITQPFYIGKLEVTQAQYIALEGEKSNRSKHEGLDLPVEKVSWYDTQLFIRKFNKLKLGQFRLPTEAEWEYACHLSDSLGIRDMKGSLCEWCDDKYRKSFDRDSQFDPNNHGKWYNLIWPLTNRVFKGESAGIDLADIPAFRGFEQALDYNHTIGFRIVREVEQ